jgi:hypothetical protein
MRLDGGPSCHTVTLGHCEIEVTASHTDTQPTVGTAYTTADVVALSHIRYSAVVVGQLVCERHSVANGDGVDEGAVTQAHRPVQNDRMGALGHTVSQAATGLCLN